MNVPRTKVRYGWTTLAMVAGAGALLLVGFLGTPQVLDYETGLVPWGVPLVAAALAIAVAELGLAPDFESSTLARVLVVTLLALTGWSIAQLLFDGLRLVGLVPLPVSWTGFGLRLLLLLAATAALVPLVTAARADRGRCDRCGRVLPGPLGTIPRWPIVVGLLFALPYPVLRISWLLGGTLGRTAQSPADPALEAAMAGAGLLLVGLTVAVLVGRGPGRLRAALGVTGMVVGGLLAVTFGPAAVATAVAAATSGLDDTLGMAGWIPLLFYGSWPLAGIGVALGGWRCWVSRRVDCPGCGHLVT